MTRFTFNRLGLGRMLLLSAVCWMGCGGGGSGLFTDSRDGQKYRTVKIGNQMWTARNMNYQTDSGSWCYDNKKSNCKKYGRLYNWNAAKHIVCPNGWHLPSSAEWTELVTAVGSSNAGKMLKSKNGWDNHDGSSGNGTDDYGFSALPGGDRSGGSFNNAGSGGGWWTATEYNGSYVYYRLMHYYGDYVGEAYIGKGYGFSVRCVAD